MKTHSRITATLLIFAWAIVFTLALLAQCPGTSAQPVPTVTPTNLPVLYTRSLDTADTTNTNTAAATDANANTTTANTYIYITCPIEIYRGTPDHYEIADILTDDFEEVPEHWLYVLTPLTTDENYYVSLDLSCRTEGTQNSTLTGQVTMSYSSHLPDGELGAVRIEVTEQIGPNTFLVYYGEIKYISDGNVNLTQSGYSTITDCRFLNFTLKTTQLPDNTQPVNEQHAYRLVDPAATLDIITIGDAMHAMSVYDADLSEYMYPYHRYRPPYTASKRI